MTLIKAKEKKCKKCHVSTMYRKNGMCMDCYKDWLLNTEEGKKKLKQSTLRAHKMVQKEEKQKDKERKLESKSIRVLIIEAKEPFQKLIRIRDHRKKCICCDKILPFDLGAYDAGHFKKAELYSGLIFHPDNVHGQMKYCNKYLNGNESGYAEGLKTRIGIEKYNELVELSIKLKSYKWDRRQLIDLKKHYTTELRVVESGKKDISEVDFSPGIIFVNKV